MIIDYTTNTYYTKHFSIQSLINDFISFHCYMLNSVLILKKENFMRQSELDRLKSFKRNVPCGWKKHEEWVNRTDDLLKISHWYKYHTERRHRDDDIGMNKEKSDEIYEVCHHMLTEQITVVEHMWRMKNKRRESDTLVLFYFLLKNSVFQISIFICLKSFQIMNWEIYFHLFRRNINHQYNYSKYWS